MVFPEFRNSPVSPESPRILKTRFRFTHQCAVAAPFEVRFFVLMLKVIQYIIFGYKKTM
jgi:hypothetical protein